MRIELGFGPGVAGSESSGAAVVCQCPGLAPVPPLWVTGNLGTAAPRLRGFTAGQLTASNANAPAIDLVLNYGATPGPAAESPLQVISDCAGNAWVLSNAGGGTPWRLWKFAVADLLASGTIAPVLTLTGPAGIDNANSAAFDPACNLWLGARNTATGRGILQKIPASTLAQAGSYTVVPEVSLQAGASIWYALDKDIAFDAAGNLWLASYSASPSISKVTVAQQQVTDLAIVPDVRWVGSNLAGPEGLAFGANGLLWLADYNTNSLKAFDTAAPGGNPAPTIAITSAGNLNGPFRIEFDAGGNLWVLNFNNWRLLRFDAADLLTSGARTPSVVLSWPGLAPSVNAAGFCFSRG